jgi:hypothetical protein
MAARPAVKPGEDTRWCLSSNHFLFRLHLLGFPA